MNNEELETAFKNIIIEATQCEDKYIALMAITQIAEEALKVLSAQQGVYKRGDLVKKKGDKGQWHGVVCGEYSATCTHEGYNVESLLEKGSVQIYPASSLEPWDGESK